MISQDSGDTDLELILNPIKIRLFLCLLNEEYATFSRLIRVTRSNYKILSRHLEDMKRLGIIQEYRINKIRIFKINYKSKISSILAKFISEWRTLH